MADWIVTNLPCPDGSTYTVGYFFCSLKWNFAFPSSIIPRKKIKKLKKKEDILKKKISVRLKVTTTLL